MFNCISPYSVRHKLTGENMDFPCGKCYDCLRRRISGWSFRLVKEGRSCLTSFFVTLTYNTDEVPITKNGFMSLDKEHFPLFMKRYRKAHIKKYGKSDKYPIRYFAVGEYGGKTNRPHYHAIMFNVDILLVEKCWKHGYIHCGSVSEASIGYTLKYMMKESKIPMHRNDDRQKEFQLMSKGLGYGYLTDNVKEWHKNDLLNRMYCPLEDGKKIAMPRYYKLKLYSDSERLIIGNHVKQLLVDKPDLTGEEELQRFDVHLRKLKKSRLYENL